MDSDKTQKDTKEINKAPETYYIKVLPDGPYAVYGNPPLDQQVIRPNEEGNSWLYQKGKQFEATHSPYHLCRCGASKKNPFCDGSHVNAEWDPQETAPFVNILDGSKWYDGEEVSLSDNEKYCAYARFCDPYGRVWKIAETASTDKDKEIFYHETGHCPAGRLIGWDKNRENPFEPEFTPSISILEDPQIKVSGPIWVKGCIKIESADGKYYELRNRVTLCRCGQSSNKPFCDGTHASFKWNDDLPLPDADDGSETW